MERERLIFHIDVNSAFLSWESVDRLKKDPSARRFETISFSEVLARKLAVMDAAAFSLCSENRLHIVVFDFDEPGALLKVLTGDNSVGTVVS